MTKIFDEITAERKRQNEKWGEQNYPMIGLGLYGDDRPSPSKTGLLGGLDYARSRQKTKNICWFDILMEEAYEAFIEDEPEKQREEMIQVAVVAVQIVEYLDRKIKDINPFKGKSDERNCHCNNCEAKFREGNIVIKGGEEYCPGCGELGYIADEEADNAGN